MEIKIEREKDDGAETRFYEVTGMPPWRQPADDIRGSWFGSISLGGEPATPEQMRDMMKDGALAADPGSLAEDGTANIYLPIDPEESVADGRWDVRSNGFPTNYDDMCNVLDGAGEMVIRYEWAGLPVEINITFTM